MKKTLTVLFLTFALVGLLTIVGCGGGGDGGNPVGAGVGTPSTTTFGTGYKAVSIQNTVLLPVGSTLKNTELTLLSSISSASVNETGVASVSGVIIDSTQASVLSLVTNTSGNPVLLKQVLGDGSNAAVPMSASTTAEALVLYDPVFLRMSAANQALARQKLAAHAQMAVLVKEIENAVKADPADPLNGTTHAGIFTLAVSISSDILAQIPQTNIKGFGRISSAMDSGSFVGVSDDEQQKLPSLFLINNTFAHYDIAVTKNTKAYPNSQGGTAWRAQGKSLVSLQWDWPPVSLNQAVKVEVSPGDADLTFAFTKLSGLTVFDGLMRLTATMLGVAGDNVDELEKGYKVLLAGGGKMLDLINTIVSKKPNTKAEALDMLKDLMWGSVQLGYTVIVEYGKDYFAAKIKAMFNDSWVKAVAKLTASKALIWAQGSYGLAEMAAMVMSVSQAPNTYSESGKQLNGLYPASSTTSTSGTGSSTTVVSGTGLQVISDYAVDINSDWGGIKLETVLANEEDHFLSFFSVDTTGTSLNSGGNPTLGNWSYYRLSGYNYRPIKYKDSSSSLDSVHNAETWSETTYGHDARESKGSNLAVGDVYYFYLNKMYGVLKITEITTGAVKFDWKYNKDLSLSLGYRDPGNKAKERVQK